MGWSHVNPSSIQQVTTCKQLTKTLKSKRPAVDRLIVVYCSTVNFATINATMSLYSIVHTAHSNCNHKRVTVLDLQQD